ncbi:MAG: amidohydrolase family protein [Chloroflexi bacterium]|nr:amidohydrolase family protein [Chloroflexota bacterium]
MQQPLSDLQLQTLMNEGGNPIPPGTSRWDTPVGLAVRRHCAPVLGLEPFADPAEYLARRGQLGPAEVNRRLLAAAGLGGQIIDTGYRSDDIASPTEMSEIVGVPTWEIVRLERVAEDAAASGVTAEGYPRAFRDTLAARAASAVGFKSVLAYRGGFAVDAAPPSDAEVTAAAGRWLAAAGAGGASARVTDPVLLRFGIWAAAEVGRARGLPIQFHVGYGDTDLTLHQSNPSLLSELIRRLGTLGTGVVLLHCYPYHREAAYLADAFPNVVFDLGLALSFTGASAGRVLADAMELAPFTKHLYSSDGFGAAELHYLGARHFRDGLARVLGGWIDDGACTLREAERIARLIASENARRVYPLG